MIKQACQALMALTIAAATCGAVLAQDESEAPLSESTKTICESADDLRLIIGFLRDTSISEDGVIPVVVGGIAGISEARELAGLVGETLRPPVEVLIVSLQGLRDLSDGFEDDATLGAKIAALGGAITEIGEAMDALSLQLQERCPTDD